MIKANKNKLISAFFKIYHNRLLQKHFYRIHLNGEENLRPLNNFSTILYANHSNWWDGFIAYQLTSQYLKVDDYLMMDIKQMHKYSFFKYVGVFSVNREEAREGVEAINYAAELLKKSGRYLWIFPQGIMKVQDNEPIKFFPGITRIAEKLGNVNLIPVSLRYEFVNEQRPEVFIKIGKPDKVNNDIADTKAYTEYLQNKLNDDLKILRSDVVNQSIDKYRVIFKGKRSRNKTVDKLYE